jgi:flagellar FliL protein
MFKNKIVMLTVILLIGITLIGGTAFGLWYFLFREAEPVDPNAAAEQQVEHVEVEKPPLADIVAATVEMDEMTTTLKSGNFIKIQIALQFEDAKQAESFKAASFISGDMLMRILADSTADEIKGEKGIGELATKIMNKINNELAEEKIVKVYVKTLMVQ